VSAIDSSSRLALRQGRTHTIRPMRDPIGTPTLSPETEPTARFVPLPGAPAAPPVIVYSIHDGSRIPPFATPEARRWASERCTTERDWGANRLAQRIGAALGLDGVWQMQVARSVLDFGRLRGITTPGTDHYNRRALAPEFAARLQEPECELVLQLYDRAEADLHARIAARRRATGAPLVLLGVHTFDPVGTDGRGGPLRPRPPVSLLHVPERLARETYLGACVTGRPHARRRRRRAAVGGGEGEGRVAARSGEACLPRKQGRLGGEHHGYAQRSCACPWRSLLGLRRPPSAVRFADVLRAIEPGPGVQPCAFGLKRCDALAPCPLHGAWAAINEAITKWAESTTLQSCLAPPR
jgi:hypothetical protein